MGANGTCSTRWLDGRDKMLRLICSFLIAVSPVANAGQFYSYAQWEQLEGTLRAVYIAGVFDSLLGIVNDRNNLPATKHYDDCITRANMTNGELADKVMAFVKTRPDLQRRSVPGALINYLVTFCGPPPVH
jgi:hypothetical protein